MSSLVPSKNLPVETVERHGVNFYRLKYQPQELWVAGVDISRELGVAHPGKHADNIFRNNKPWLGKHSKIISLKRHDAPSSEGVHEREVFRDIRVYNEIGFNFFISRSNTKRGLDHLLTILEDYHQLKNQRSKNKSLEWQQAREESKKQRRTLMDTVKLFVEYAKENGSKHAETYHMNVNRKINKILFGVKTRETPDNFVDHLNEDELKIFSIVSRRIEAYFLANMAKGVYYKDIFAGFNPILENAKLVLDFEKQNYEQIEVAK